MKKNPEFKDCKRASKWLSECWPALEASGLRSDDLLTLFLRDFEELNFRQIGQVFGYSHTMAHRVYHRIRRRLRHPMRGALVLMDYRIS